MSSLCVSAMIMLSTALTSLATTSAPAGTSDPKVVAASDKAVRTAHAAQYFEGGRYVEAALEFEELRRDYPADPAILFNATASRDAAGHHAHAVAYVREYLARMDLGPDDRKQGEEQLGESIRKVTAVTVTVRLPLEGPGAITLVARHVARRASDLRPDLRFVVPARGQPMTLELDPDAWIVRAEGPGYQPVEQQLTVGATPLAITLRPVLVPIVGPATPRSPVVAPAVVRKTRHGLLIGGGVAAVAGLGVLGAGVGMIHAKHVKACTDPTLGACRRDFANGLVVRNVGTSLFGAGAGLAAGALVWRLPAPRQRMLVWSSLAAVGGVGLVLGEILVVRGTLPFSRDNTDPGGTLAGWPEHWSSHRHSTLPALAASLRGLGLGLLAGAATGLIVQRKHLGPGGARAIRVDPRFGPGHAGVALSGRF